MPKYMNFDLTNPEPFIKKYINKNNHLINKYCDLLFENPNLTQSDEWKSLPELTQKLAFELSLFKLDDKNYYL